MWRGSTEQAGTGQAGTGRPAEDPRTAEAAGDAQGGTIHQVQ